MAECLPSTTKESDAMLKCPLCLHQLNIATTLTQCFHSYCKSCIEAVPQKTSEDKQGRFCPQCNGFATVDQMKHNLFIENVIRIHNQHSKEGAKKLCVQCKTDKNVSGMCKQCKINLCDNCQVGHLDIPFLKGHSIIPFGDKTNNVVDNVVFCPIHAENVIERNCTVCEELICVSCAFENHDKHDSETVDKALERLLPQVMANTDNIKLNVHKMEKQIKGLDHKMEEVKESYAACRLTMDNKLDIMISKLKSIKATLEDNIIEQESIALDKLKHIKKDLENQIIKSKQISSCVEMCINNAKDASLLNEIQGGLFGVVRQQGDKPVENIHFQIPISDFQENLTNLEEQLSAVFGSPDITDENGRVNTAGNLWVDDQYMCQDFNDVFINLLQKSEVNLEKSWHNRITLIDRKIWAPALEQYKIEIFTQDGVLDKTLETESIVVVKKTNNGDIIAGGDEGLYVTNTDCTEWNKIADGRFTDIVLNGSKFSALNFQGSGRIMTFTLQHQGEFSAGDKPTWRVENTFSLDSDMKITANSTLGFSNNHYVIASFDGESVYIFTSDNPPVKTHSKYLGWSPFVCGSDRAGNILLCNFLGGELYVLDPVSGDITELTHTGIELPYICDTVIDTDNNVWCLKYNNGNIFSMVCYSKT